MVVGFTATFMTFPGDLIIFSTITHVNKIHIILLVLLHHAHGNVVELADLLITPSNTRTPNTITPRMINYVCQTRHIETD